MQVSLADTETEHEDVTLPNNEKLRWKIRGEEKVTIHYRSGVS